MHSKKIVLFLNITRRSKIVSRAVATRAPASVDHLQYAVAPKYSVCDMYRVIYRCMS